MIEGLLIAIAICVDSFALGITYGIKQIKIPKTAILVINMVTICTLSISIYSGHIIRQFISEETATMISCLVLVGLGSFFIIEGYLKYLAKNKDNDKLVKFHIPRLGIIIDIAFDVTKADMDISGDINIKEALYLGIVLAIDALGAGFGFSMGGSNYFYFLFMVFIINILSISYGVFLGGRIESYRNNLKTSLLPGSILICIGILKWL